jgi:hypothetical protein
MVEFVPNVLELTFRIIVFGPGRLQLLHQFERALTMETHRTNEIHELRIDLGG